MRQTLNLVVMPSCGDQRGTLGGPNACARRQGDVGTQAGGGCRSTELVATEKKRWNISPHGAPLLMEATAGSKSCKRTSKAMRSWY
jgi:hypothetical protein